MTITSFRVLKRYPNRMMVMILFWSMLMLFAKSGSSQILSSFFSKIFLTYFINLPVSRRSKVSLSLKHLIKKKMRLYLNLTNQLKGIRGMASSMKPPFKYLRLIVAISRTGKFVASSVYSRINSMPKSMRKIPSMIAWTRLK